MMRTPIALLLFTFACGVLAAPTFKYNFQRELPGDYYSCYADNVEVKKGYFEDADAWGKYDDSITADGWTRLELHTNPHSDAKKQAFAAGILEGRLTQPILAEHKINVLANYFGKGQPIPPRTHNFLIENYNIMKAKAALLSHLPGGEGEYWTYVKLTFLQFDGVLHGFNSADISEDDRLSLLDLLALNADGDLDDITAALNETETLTSLHVRGQRCSALVKLTENELFNTHTTWSGYGDMLRVYKLYDFPFGVNGREAQAVQFSASPGFLSSIDDFYLTSNKLSTQETTNSVYNMKLYEAVKPSLVLEWVRVIVANKVATTGKEWCDVFSKENSGTYNNQYMIIDYKLYEAGQPLKEGTFWVLEQIPGYIESADMSAHLEEHKYWGSYNIPYFKKIYDMSGWVPYLEKYGAYFSHDNTSRALIFARDHSKVTDMEGMKAIIRYNDFQHDPLSFDNGELSIAGRSDLNPADKHYFLPELSHRCHGAIDAKITSSKTIESLSSLAICGPTRQQQPAWVWSESDFDKEVSHIGQPDKFDFDWVVM